MDLRRAGVYLFTESVRDNIRLGRPDATDTEVEAAARAALAHEFVAALPDGCDTVAGEMGSRLSGGQRQRIAIARALLCDSPILVMDEAVSNLDAESELEVGATMAVARTGRTTMVIAHQLSTIRPPTGWWSLTTAGWPRSAPKTSWSRPRAPTLG
ncbi:MAG: ATP-binding cassette domain-containing protein [Pseudonocardia sp.]